MIQTCQTLGVPDKEITIFRQSVVEVIDQGLLCHLVEVDHNISAKNYIKNSACRRNVHKVESLEGHHVPDRLIDAVVTSHSPSSPLEIFL